VYFHEGLAHNLLLLRLSSVEKRNDTSVTFQNKVILRSRTT
jgi:hypothetical protein